MSMHAERTPGEASLRAASTVAYDAFPVVEHEFEGGPYAGRRLTGLACIDDLHVVPSADAGTRLVDGLAPARCLGTYRFRRAYDCLRTLERVHVYRWDESHA
jgi:hypothetical protein